jgi:hypothetical protein
MSFHTTTMLVRWVVSTDEKTSSLLDELKNLPLEQLIKDDRVISIVKNLKLQWSSGTKIERLATLGWIEYDSIYIFSNILKNIDNLRTEYKQQIKLHGTPPPLKDEDLKSYEKAIWQEIENMKKTPL